MDVIVQRPAALDVHREQMTACVRFTGSDGGRTQEVREFKTTVGGLLLLYDLLQANGVTQVAMEATGQLCPAQADPRAPRFHPLSRRADQGARAGGQPAAQGARAGRNQARLRRDRDPRRLRTGDARRAIERSISG